MDTAQYLPMFLAEAREHLDNLGKQAQPIVLARDRSVGLSGDLGELIPGGALVRGSVLRVESDVPGAGSTSVAFELGEKTDDPLAMYMNDFFTVPMSLAGIPAISIPAGIAEPEGGGPQLPVGFQIAAPAFAEQRLLDAAYALEQAIDG